MINVDQVTRFYYERKILDEISFKVNSGEIHGFLGPNGAGKSTTLKIISGILAPSSGTVTVQGRIGFLPEDPPLYPQMTVIDYLNFVSEIFADHSHMSAKSIQVQVDEALVKTGLTSVTNRLIGNLSKGYKQRVGMAQAIVHSPSIIILDEPTIGLDPLALLETRELIKELAKEHTIIFSSHQLAEVEALCTNITLINKGKILVTGPTEKIRDSLSGHISYYAKIENFSEEIRKEMLTLFSLINIDTELNEGVGLRITTKSKSPSIYKTEMKEIIKFLSQDNIGLYEFKTEKKDLEELFKNL